MYTLQIRNWACTCIPRRRGRLRLVRGEPGLDLKQVVRHQVEGVFGSSAARAPAVDVDACARRARVDDEAGGGEDEGEARGGRRDLRDCANELTLRGAAPSALLRLRRRSGRLLLGSAAASSVVSATGRSCSTASRVASSAARWASASPELQPAMEGAPPAKRITANMDVIFMAEPWYETKPASSIADEVRRAGTPRQRPPRSTTGE